MKNGLKKYLLLFKVSFKRDVILIDLLYTRAKPQGDQCQEMDLFCTQYDDIQ